VDLQLSAAQEGLRAAVRGWLAQALPWGQGKGVQGPPVFGTLSDEVSFLREWQRRLAEAGYVGVQWPAEFGGRGLGAVEAMIVNEELARAGFPELVGRIGVNLVGPTLLQHGTKAQNSRWLPHILNAGHLWCQLFSEPEAGSDLASLRTTARRADDRWILTGQKVWTSFAQFADWGLCLARAGDAGITAFAVDMRAPGVTARPLVQLTGESEFNEVFLDDVAVSDDCVIGAVGQGWRVAMSTLVRERGVNPRQLVIHLQHLDAMFRLAQRHGRLDDAGTRQALGRAYVGVHLFRMHSLRMASALSNGSVIGPEGSAVKLHWSEASKELHRAALDILGGAAIVGRDGQASADGPDWQREWLYYLGSSIWAGTNELQRNIIGERVLGLPREGASAGARPAAREKT
jgi:alkylation response protein AidB-like acyl-CoA dehydrogenase